MRGLPVEAESVILEESSLQCCQVPFYYRHCPSLRHHLLGPWWQNVSHDTHILYSKQSATVETLFISCSESRSQSQDLFNAMGSMYAAVLFIGVMNCTSVQPVVAVERTVFYRERAAGMYSAFPYAFGQVSVLIQINQFQAFFFPTGCCVIESWTVITINFSVAGCHWTSIHTCSGYRIWGHSLLDDWVWVDSSQILLVPLLHVLHAALLHILRHDGCWPHTELPHCINHFVGILCHLESLLRIHHPPTGKFHHLWQSTSILISSFL